MERVAELVSVIIPCYNHGTYLKEALESILEQTYQNMEIIVVNDGSDEEVTLDSLNNLDRPGTTVYHKENGGASSARNYGIEKSRGEFILTLDADDKFAPDFLEKAMAVLKKQPNVGMVTSYQLRFGPNRKNSKSYLKGGDITDFLAKNQCHASLLYRYQCWVDAGGYDEEIPGFEDWDFAIGVTKNGWIVYSIPEFLSYYRDLDGSVFDLHLKNSPEIIKYMVKKHKEIYQEQVVDVLYKKECDLRNLRDSVRTYKNSFSLKIGNSILQPIRWVKGVSRN